VSWRLARELIFVAVVALGRFVGAVMAGDVYAVMGAGIWADVTDVTAPS
jgi:hypothetical protein